MNLLISLFGGMLVTALLYGLGRVLKLSNFWAAVSAAGFVCVVYLAYVVGSRPGLDVVTLHLVAYPTVSVLLYQLYGEKARFDTSMHWAPKLMMGFFAVLTVLYGGFVHVASHGLPPALAGWLLPNAKERPVYTGFAGVVEHNQDAAKGIAQFLKMEDRLAKLGWRLEISGLSDVKAGRPLPVSVQVLDRSGRGVDGVEIRLSTSRPGQTPSAPVRLKGDGKAGYHATLGPLEAGSWVAHLHLEGAEARPITLEHTLQVR
ncbi:MAG: hypothetical protein ACUVT2_03900 [Thiobacillaceae bacterium]